MARVPYIARNEIAEAQRSLLGTYEELGSDFRPHVVSPSEGYNDAGDDTEPYLYQALANNLPILRAFRQFSSDLRAECGLDERTREIVILTTARSARARYEWHQHVRIGRAVGLSDGEILEISNGRTDTFEDSEEALIEYVVNLVGGTVSDDHHDALSEFFTDSEIVGIVVVSQFYTGLSKAIEAFDLDIGEPFVGWTPGSPDR